MEYKYRLDHQAIADQIRAARKRANLTQAELAERVDVSTNAIAKLENNMMAAGLQTLLKIANTLHLDLNALFLPDLPEDRSSSVDMILDSQLRTLSRTDKEFLIHTINGIRLHYHSESDE